MRHRIFGRQSRSNGSPTCLDNWLQWSTARRGIVGEEFSAAQLAALSHPFDGEETPNSACTWYMPAEGRSAILTCDVDAETAETFGGPVWHASVCPPIRAHAEVLLAGVGEGVLFKERSLRPDVCELRRRMTLDEIRRIGGSSP